MNYISIIPLNLKTLLRFFILPAIFIFFFCHLSFPAEEDVFVRLIFPAGESLNDMKAGDFDSNGTTDLLLCDGKLHSVHVLLGEKGGGFKESSIPAPSQPLGIATGDFNSNGVTDLAVINWNTVLTLTGNGDGTFQKRMEKKIEKANITAVASGDFNIDGCTDLLLGEKNSGLLFMSGKGDGTFEAPLLYASVSNPLLLRVEDFDLDGIPDLAILDRVMKETSTMDKLPDMVLNNYTEEEEEIIIFKGREDGTGERVTPIKGGIGKAGDLKTGDINGDFYPDLIISKPEYNLVTVLYGLGGCFFGKREDVKTNLKPVGTGLKYNEKNLPHIITANRGDNSLSIISLKENKVLSFKTGPDPDMVTAGDFNGDGSSDLASISAGKGNLYINQGIKSGGYYDGYSALTGREPSDIATGDFNCDGITDLAVTNPPANNMSILFGLGDGSFYGWTQKTKEYPCRVEADDFNEDGFIDLVTVNRMYNGISIFTGDGKGGFRETFSSKTGKRATDVVSGDLNSDGHRDLALLHFEGNNISILMGKGDGTFQKGENYNTGEEPEKLLSGDFNGDGFLDLAVVENKENLLSLFPGKGDGTFGDAINFPAGEGPLSSVTGDFNYDGFSDLIVTDQATKSLTLFTGHKENFLVEKEKIKLKGTPLSVISGYLNDDPIKDFAVSCKENFLLIIEGHEEEIFKNTFEYIMENTTVAIAGDFIGKKDREKSLDLLLLNQKDEYITLLLNKVSWNEYEKERERVILSSTNTPDPNEIIPLSPLSLEAYYKEGLSCEERGEMEEAKNLYEKALTIVTVDKNMEESHMVILLNSRLAYCYYSLGEPERAEEICRRIENKSLFALFTLALIHAEKGNTKISVSLLKEYIKKLEESPLENRDKYLEAKDLIVKIEKETLGEWSPLIETLRKSSGETEKREAFNKIREYTNYKIKKELVEVYKKEKKTFASYNWLISGLEEILSDYINEPWKQYGYLTKKDFFAKEENNNIYRPSTVDKIPEIKTQWNDTWHTGGNKIYVAPSIFYTGLKEPETKGSLLYKSEDGGFSWEKIFKTGEIILEVTEVSDEVLVCTGGEWVNPEEERVNGSGGTFYRSPDGGITWEELFTVNSPVRKILTDWDGQIYLLTGDEGLFASSDRGENWYLCNYAPQAGERKPENLKGTEEIENKLKYWTKKVLECENPEIKFIYLLEQDKEKQIFVLLGEEKINLNRELFTYNYILTGNEEGDNWTAMKWPEEEHMEGSVGEYNDIYWYKHRGRWNKIRIFSINDTGEVFVGYKGGKGLYKTANAGEDWEFIPAVPGFDIYDAEIDPRDSLFVTVYTYGKIFESTDGGLVWQEVLRRNNLERDDYVKRTEHE